MTRLIARASPPNTPTSGLTTPAIPVCIEPMNAAAVPAIAPYRVRAIADAFGGTKLISPSRSHSAASRPNSPPAPVRATTSRARESTSDAGTATRKIRIGETRRTKAALTCAPPTSATPFIANRSANWFALSPKPSRSTNGDPTT